MVFCASLRTFLLYWLSSSVNSYAASGFAGEAGFGSVSRDWIDVSRVHTLCMGDHWSWMMSMHSVPSEYTFGWNTSEVNRTLGGFSGYCSPNVIRSENTPPVCGWSVCGVVRHRQFAAVMSSVVTSGHDEDPDVDNLFWLTGHSTHLPRLSRPGRRSWRSRRIGYRRCEGSHCIPVVANRVSGMDGQRDGRGGRREAGDGTLGSFLALPRQERGLCGRGALPPRAKKRARRWARGGWKLTSGGSVLMALRSDCSLSTAAVCWHDAPAIAPSPELAHSCLWVCLR